MKRRNQSKSAGNTSAAPPEKRRSAGGEHFPTFSPQSGWAVAVALVVIALAAVAAYLNSFAVPFLFDDLVWISNNTSIRHLSPIWQVLYPPHDALVRGRPVVSLTLAINYALGGMNVWGYHVLNLAIHVLATWTLFGIVRRTLMLPKLRERFGSAATPLALVVALVWMLHPLQTESVTYVIQRTEALVGLLYLLTVYCTIRAATSTSARMMWYIAATVACLLGMATKELMVTAPVIVLLYDRTFLAGSFQEAWRRRYGLYLAMAATWGVIALSVISTGFYGGTAGFDVQKFTWWSYLLTQPGVIAHYLRLAFWPAELCFDYGWPAARTLSQVLFPGLLLVGLFGLTIWALAKRPAWGFLGAWFFVILAPTSSFIPIQDAAFEHRMYLSLASVVAAVVIGGWLAGQRRIRGRQIPLLASPIVCGALALCVIVTFGILTFHRNADYRSALSIWQDTAVKVPNSDRAHTNFGESLARCGQIDAAIIEYQWALQLNPNCELAHVNLGKALVARGRLDEAIAHYQQALKIKPNSELAHNNFGVALTRRGQFDEAVTQYQKALDIKPDFAEAHYNLGLALAKLGQSDDAIAQYHRALELKPDYAEAHNDLGIALLRRERFDDAVVHLRRAVEIKANDAGAQNNLGAALERCGRLDEAIVHFRKALEIEPDFAEARKNLADALGRQRKTE